MGLSIITTPQELWKFGTHERAARGTPLNLGWRLEGNAITPSFTTVQLSGTVVGYSVTAGKTLVLTRVLFRSLQAGQIFGIGYSDSDLGANSAVDGANPVGLGHGSTNFRQMLVATSANVLYDMSLYYAVPAGKYPRVAMDNVESQVFGEFFGHEV